jgi:hypothetical protein
VRFIAGDVKNGFQNVNLMSLSATLKYRWTSYIQKSQVRTGFFAFEDNYFGKINFI